MAKKILVIYSAKNSSPFYTHSAELYNRKWKDLSAISRKAAFEKQVLFSQMWFQFAAHLYCQPTSAYRSSRNNSFPSTNHRYVCDCWWGLSFAPPSFFFFSNFLFIYIGIKVYVVCSEHCHILSLSCHGMKKHACCMTELSGPFLMDAGDVCHLLLAFICRCTKKCHFSPLWHRAEHGSVWMRWSTPVMSNCGVPGVDLQPCLSSCLSITDPAWPSLPTQTVDQPSQRSCPTKIEREANSQWDKWGGFIFSNRI